MPKIKTHSGASKRFKVNGKGKIKRTTAYRRHRLISKTKRQKANSNKPTYLAKADEKQVKRMLPYK